MDRRSNHRARKTGTGKTGSRTTAAGNAGAENNGAATDGQAGTSDRERRAGDVPRRDDVRHGLRLSVASIVWTVVTGVAEVGLGVADHVLSLVVFGAAGALDAAGSMMLVINFRHVLRHDVVAEHHERRAAIVIGAGLGGLGTVTIVEAVRRLAAGTAEHGAEGGAVIAVASAVVLAGLAAGKQRTGRRLGSRALVADGWLSATGAVLAVMAVAAASLGGQVWWLDPAAAIVIAAGAGGYGAVLLWREVARYGVESGGDPPPEPED